MSKKNVSAIVEEIERFLKTVRKDPSYTYWHALECDDPVNDWAIVFRWEESDDEENGGHFRGMVAYQPNNSMMQEYECDWLMPYDEDTGDVWDTELRIDDEEDIAWLVEQWFQIKDEYVEKAE